MTIRRRPSAPWYAPATRRLALIRVGLPTLAACLIAVGPGAAAQAPRMVQQQAAALVVNATNAAQQVLNPPPGDQGPHDTGNRPRDIR